MRELVFFKRVTLLVLLNLFFGMTALLIVQGFKDSLGQELQAKSKEILTADLAVSSRRAFTEEEKTIIRKILSPFAVSEGLEFLSMISVGDRAQLGEIKGVDDLFPLIGGVELTQNQFVKSPEFYKVLQPGTVIVYPELAHQFHLNVGDSLRLGEKTFRIADTVKKDSSFSFRTSSIAGRVFVRFDEIPLMKLTGRGATSNHLFFARLKDDSQLQGVIDELNEKLHDPAVQVSSHKMAAEDTGRMLAYLSDYLGLVALVGFLLANLGATFLLRKLLVMRLSIIGIYRALGFSSRDVLALFFFEVLVLVGISFGLALVASEGSLRILSVYSPQWMGQEISLHLPLATSSFILALSFVFTALSIFPFAYESHFQKIPLLFSQQFVSASQKIFWVVAALNIALLFGLSVYLSHSFNVGGLFVASFLALCGVFFGLVLAVFKWLPYENIRNVHWRLVFLSLARKKRTGSVSTVALALGTLLLIFVPQIQRGLLAEVSSPEGVKVPDFFLFDIQPDQLPSLQSFLKERELELKNVSPMVRSRLLQVNGESFEKKSLGSLATREEERESRFRNRGFNLTYRTELSDSETLVEGRPFSGRFDGASGRPAEVSVEQNFADRFHWKLGDRLIFDVQGVEVSAEIVNLRKVKWTSFQPNFFVQFQSGVLEDAPQIYLGALHAVPAEAKDQLQSDLVKSFSNVSLLDVSRVIENLLEVAGQMALALKVMALLSVLVGFIVLFAILSTEVGSRMRDINLLRLIGFSLSETIYQIRVECGLIASFGAVLGLLGSYVLSWLVAYFVFDRIWSFSWDWALGLSVVLIVVSWVGSGLLVRSLVKQEVTLQV